MDMQPTEALVRQVSVFPIVMPRSVRQSLETIAALAEGGARGIELVLRGPDAMTALRLAVERFPMMTFAAGTVLTPDQYDAAIDAGANLTISPGLSLDLVDHAARGGVPNIPGVQTATEIMAARKVGLKLLKFYPSEPAGGIAVLRDLCSIFPDISLMPSGRITFDTIPGYSATPGIASIGGSWMHSENGASLAGSEIAGRMRRSLEMFDRSS